jgi:hypothetical protein
VLASSPHLEERAATAAAAEPRVASVEREYLKTKVSEWDAGYAMYWALRHGKFEIVAEYITPERKAALREKRGDDDSFCSSARAARKLSPRPVTRATFDAACVRCACY